MKKYFFAVICFFCIISAGYSQDKIITINKDTIDCKINKVSHNTIFFELITSGVKSTGSLPLKSILNYLIGPESPEYFQNYISTESFQKLRFGLRGGLGYILSSTKNAESEMTKMGFEPDKVKSYYSNLRTGMCVNADLTWFFTVKYGAGIKYKFFNTADKTEGHFDPQDGVSLYYTTFSEHIYVNYIAGAFYYQEYFGRRKSLKLNTGISLGSVMYRNEAKFLNYYLMTGRSFGMDVNLGVEYFLTQHLSINADLSNFSSTITKMELSDGISSSTLKLEKENFENLSRMDISFGIIIYLGN